MGSLGISHNATLVPSGSVARFAHARAASSRLLLGGRLRISGTLARGTAISASGLVAVREQFRLAAGEEASAGGRY